MSDAISVSHDNGVAAARAYSRQAVAPPVDVYENADEVLIVADVPGVPDENMDLKVENDTLTLEARRGPAKEEHPALAREFEALDFSASFRIPAGIEASAVSAESKNGTLTVHLPKAAAAKPRKITVHSES
ncbi:MAG: Hsp20/alpha crystallin family protein [Polyangiaceae bacterium]|jgi:HSP20 family molecular chaperone IbpA